MEKGTKKSSADLRKMEVENQKALAEGQRDGDGSYGVSEKFEKVNAELSSSSFL